MDFETHYGSFTKEDWKRIQNALQYYYQDQHTILSEQNCGDREWNELDRYKDIMNDIELHILSSSFKKHF